MTLFAHSLCGQRHVAPPPRVIAVQDAQRNDPTRTHYLRARMRAEGDKRWQNFARTVREALTKMDLMGQQGIGQLAHAGNKTEACAAWMRAELQHKVFGFNGGWMRPYVQQAAQLAGRHAAESAPGGQVDSGRTAQMEALAVSELRGIVEVAQQQITRAVTHSLMASSTQFRTANQVAGIVRKMRQRTRAMSEYVVGKTYSAATLSAFRGAGVTQVGVVPERIRHSSLLKRADALTDAPRGGREGPVSRGGRSASTIARAEQVQEELETALPEQVDVLTAGDNLVCPVCEEIAENGPYDLEEAEGLIPAHPWCRCAFVPAGEGETRDGGHWDETIEPWRWVPDAEWNEEDHPRGEGGKFTSGGDLLGSIVQESKELSGAGGDKLPEPVVQAFTELGNAQRGAPEAAMLKVQFANGGGRLNPLVEHGGDLTHRMTEMAKYGDAGYDAMKEKVANLLRWTSDEFGLQREIAENFKNNAEYYGMPVEDLKAKVGKTLDRYVSEHEKLPAYNEAQFLARQVAIRIGEQDWTVVSHVLRRLDKMMPDRATWTKHAFKHELDEHGQPMRWTGVRYSNDADWNEEDHPRGEGGRFAKSGEDLGESLRGDKKITDLKGNKILAPRTFYRGDVPGETRRISTGTEFDQHLFAADNIDAAKSYGEQITRIDAKPDAKILYEGTQEYNRLLKGARGGSLLDHSLEATRRAAKAGYDAVWFKRQGDVGTAIINRDKFIIRGITRDADWNEKDHPRGEGGKFSESGGQGELPLEGGAAGHLSEAGRAWFGESKVKTETGAPRVVYHGTTAPEDFSEFSVGESKGEESDQYFRSGSGADPRTFLGSHFAEEPEVASKFAKGLYGERAGESTGGRVYPAYLRVEKPFESTDTELLDEMLKVKYNHPDIDARLEDLGEKEYESDFDKQAEKYENDEDFRIEVNRYAMMEGSSRDEPDYSLAQEMASEFRGWMRRQGYDGVKYENEIEGGTSWIVFEPDQVKSALGSKFTRGKPGIKDAAAKSTKTEARYRGRPKGDQRCAVCTMFRKPHSCISVAGDISPQGWCKYYERKER